MMTMKQLANQSYINEKYENSYAKNLYTILSNNLQFVVLCVTCPCRCHGARHSYSNTISSGYR